MIADTYYGNNPSPMFWLPNNQGISSGFSFFDLSKQTFEFTRPTTIPVTSNQCSVSLSLTPNGNRTKVVAGTGNGCLVLLDASTGSEFAGYKITDNPISDADWSPDERQVVAVDWGGNVWLLEIATGNMTLLHQVEGALYSVDWSADGTTIAYGGHIGETEMAFGLLAVGQNGDTIATEMGTTRRSEIIVTPPPEYMAD